MRFTGEHFGGRTIELAGRVIHPDRQNEGIGAAMLGDFLTTHRPELLTTYTRNPAILKMIGRSSLSIFPLEQNTELAITAADMPNATVVNGITYHLNRYGEGGLFQAGDPAESSIATPPLPLNQVFPLLLNQRHALVVAARVGERK